MASTCYGSKKPHKHGSNGSEHNAKWITDGHTDVCQGLGCMYYPTLYTNPIEGEDVYEPYFPPLGYL